MNPHSNVSSLNLQEVQEDDHTVIYNIPLPHMVMNDIFVDDHQHYWSISEELTKLTPDKNPLTNLPFEPSEWERIVKAREWKRLGNHAPATVHPAPMPVVMRPPPIQVPPREPIDPRPVGGFRLVCCPEYFRCSLCGDRYSAGFNYCCCLTVHRDVGNFPGSCSMIQPCIIYEQGSNDSLCLPLCCTYCFEPNSCLFRTKARGFFFPCGWSYENSNTRREYSSGCFCLHCWKNDATQRSCVCTPVYCYCRRASWECCATPLCIEINRNYISPLVCVKGNLYCLLGIPICRM